MPNVPATEFKAKCLELMDRVAERRETYVITKRGKPVAKLVPLESTPKDSIFGWLRGCGTIVGDIISPATPPTAWETLEEWDEMKEAGTRRRTREAATRRKGRGSRR